MYEKVALYVDAEWVVVPVDVRVEGALRQVLDVSGGRERAVALRVLERQLLQLSLALLRMRARMRLGVGWVEQERRQRRLIAAACSGLVGANHELGRIPPMHEERTRPLRVLEQEDARVEALVVVGDDEVVSVIDEGLHGIRRQE